MNVVSFFIAFLIAPLAYGYVAPSFHIANKVAKKHSHFQKGKIRHRISFYGTSGELLHQLHETLLVQGDKISGRLVDEGGAELKSFSRELSDPDKPILYTLLFVRDPLQVFETFKSAGLPMVTEDELYSNKPEDGKLPYIPETLISFQPYEDRVAQVLQDRSGDVHLWIEKEEANKETSLLPLRAKLDSLEYRFESYQPHGSYRYPLKTRIYRNGQLWAGIETLELVVGKAEEGPKPSQGEPTSSVRDLIESYLKWIR